MFPPRMPNPRLLFPMPFSLAQMAAERQEHAERVRQLQEVHEQQVQLHTACIQPAKTRGACLPHTGLCPPVHGRVDRRHACMHVTR
jgi:hypothetical protein